MKEEFVEWDEGTSFTYHGRDVPMVKFAENKWTVDSVNGKTLLITESEMVMKSGILGKLLIPLVYVWSRKTGANSLAAFKYLVENGRAYKGKHSKLPKVLSTC